MGLLDKLGIGGTKEEREARSIGKLQKKVVEKFGPPENREGAIEELAELDTEGALEALLMRFTVRIDPGIRDDEEKQRVHAILVGAGEKSVPPLQRFIMARDEIAWPLKSLSEIVPEERFVTFLLETLAKAAREYSREPLKKVLLLNQLAQHKNAGATAAALPFLEDMDDDVQIAAAQAIAANQSDAGREPLIQAFLRAHEHSNARVKESLAGLLAELPWDVKGYTPKVEAALPAAYKLDSKGKVLRK
jgi:hypothetical protein